MNPIKRLNIVTRLKPAAGFSHLLHIILVILLPLLMYVMVRIDIPELALALIFLSKWRMFAVRPRYWATNVRANGIDLIVGISTVVFMVHTGSAWWELTWAILYGVWLIGIKPYSSVTMVSLQALLGQFVGMMALFMQWPTAPSYALVLGAGIICYVAARHFFDSFEEKYSRLLSYAWAYFGASLTWLLSHWLLFYRQIAQPTLLLTVIGYGMAVLYYLDHYDKLSKNIRRQFLFIMIAIIAAVLVFSNWGSKII